MRQLFAAILVGAAVTGTACGQDPKKPADDQPAAKQPAGKLGIGDTAPPLKVTKWVQGDEVKGFDKDKVYVVEFWATWCGPCIRAMPHLNELHDEYKGKGLVVIGLTSKDPNNSQKAVEEFVAKNGKRFTYRFAYCDDRDTDKAYMEASGQDGIPCTFIVGKDGKVAWIGHPMELDDVLPLVMDGKWDGKKSVDALAAVRKELEDALTEGQKDPAKGLAGLTAFVGKHPEYAARDQFMVQRMVLTMQAKKFDDAKALAEGMIALAEKKKKAAPAAFAGMILGDKQLNPDKKFLDVALKGVDLALKLEPTDIGLALSSMDVYLAAGKKEQAEAAGKTAVTAAAAQGDKVKEQVEAIIKKKLEGEKK